MQSWKHFWASANSRPVGDSRSSDSQSREDEASTSVAGARWRRLWGEEEGQTLVEYGLLIGLLALVVIVAVTFFGRRMSNNLYGTSNNVLPFNN